MEIGYAHVLVFTLESGTDLGKLADPASGTWIDVDTRPNAPGLPADLGDRSERTGHILLLDRVWLDPDHRGRDGSTCWVEPDGSRILEAVQRPGGPSERRGVNIDVGLAGESDAYGVESPSMVFTPGGYLMAYAGSDGADTRLHMAASSDGRLWKRRSCSARRRTLSAPLTSRHSRCRLGFRRLMATSEDGLSWDRRGITLPGSGDDVDTLEERSPCVLRVRDGTLRPPPTACTSFAGSAD